MSALAVRLEGVDAGFGGRNVLHDVSLAVARGQIVAVIGLNGAGKSVLGRTISGLVSVARGRVLIEERDVTRASPRQRVRLGLHHLSQRRGLVPDLTVADNVRLAAFGRGRSVDEPTMLGHPILGRWAGQLAGTLSGGEQALVALARAELLAPTILIADEPTAGLAPEATVQHASALQAMADRGTCVLLIEQNVPFALRIADRVAVLRNGSVALDTPRDDVTDSQISRALVG